MDQINFLSGRDYIPFALRDDFHRSVKQGVYDALRNILASFLMEQPKYHPNITAIEVCISTKFRYDDAVEIRTRDSLTPQYEEHIIHQMRHKYYVRLHLDDDNETLMRYAENAAKGLIETYAR